MAWRLAVRGLSVDAEQRHDAVADELVHVTARGLDGVAHGLEIAVEQEHDIIGQLLLRDLGEGAQVGEQDRDLALLALQVGRARAGRSRP